MSRENVETVRRLYRAMDAHFDTIAEFAHHDAEWIHDRRVGEGPVRGLENVIRFITEQDEMLAELRVEPERFWETGKRVLVFVHTAGRGRTSDAPFRATSRCRAQSEPHPNTDRRPSHGGAMTV
jgi:ketosteroid isomerase-like protein